MPGQRQSCVVGARENARFNDHFVVGFDSEYAVEGDHNRILSYQWFIVFAGKEHSGIALVNGKRMKLHQILAHILSDAKQAGMFTRHPKSVVLVAHFTLAEIAVLADREVLKTKFDGIRGTYASVRGGLKLTLRDQNGNVRETDVVLRDTLLLTPQKASLASLGEMHRLQKIVLPEGCIEHMDELLRDNPNLFKEYAIRDAEIAAKHALHMARLHYQLCGRTSVPISLGGLAVAFARSTWKVQGIDEQAVLGRETVQERVYNSRIHRMCSKRREVSLAAVHEHEALAKECYHGGRNEALYFGATPPGDWRDVDLCGAYSTVLAMLGMPLWHQLRVSTDLDDFIPGVLGLARIEFRFPSDTRFPCLPVRVPNNLIFPLEGESHATAPEIWLARALGAEVEIRHGIVIPLDGAMRPFQRVIAEATELREKAKAANDPLGDKLAKELVNSLYGKIAQGLREKRVFDTRQGQTTRIGPCPLTNPFIAAAVTGTIRAVLAEIMNRCPIQRRIVSVTTDGIIANLTDAELNLVTLGPLCAAFGRARFDLTGSDRVLEVKHRVKQVLSWRTRGQATLGDTEQDSVILAKAGIKPARGMSKVEQNTWITRLFIDRDIHSIVESDRLRSLNKIYKKGGDLVSEPYLRRLRMDFDWKRQASAPTMTEVNGQLHLAFDTLPWTNQWEFLRCREQWSAFQDQKGCCLKTTGDLRALKEFLAGSTLAAHSLYRSVKGGGVKAAIRQFARAFVRDAWGLESSQMSYPELADFLIHGGYLVSVDDIKNANRPTAKLCVGAVPCTEAVLKFVAYVKQRFPGFQEEWMLAPQAVPESTVQCTQNVVGLSRRLS